MPTSLNRTQKRGFLSFAPFYRAGPSRLFRRAAWPFFALVVFSASISHAEITGLSTFPEGSNGDVQINQDGIFGGRTLVGNGIVISTTSTQIILTSTASGGAVTNFADLGDGDDSARVIGSYLCFDGTNWVAVANGGNCAFSIASFGNSLSATQEIGTGVWKASGTINFTATYSNGPPTSSTITFSGWVTPLHLSSPFTSTTSVSSVHYPAVAGTVVFTLNARKDSTTDTDTITHTFVNRRFFDVTTLTGSYTEAQVEALDSELSNSKAKTFSLTAGSGEYLIWASPTRLGTVTFTVGGFEGGFNSPETVSLTNASGYTENYYVYRSVNSNLGTVNIVTE